MCARWAQRRKGGWMNCSEQQSRGQHSTLMIGVKDNSNVDDTERDSVRLKACRPHLRLIFGVAPKEAGSFPV